MDCMGEDEEDLKLRMGREMGVLGLEPGSWAGSEGVLGLGSVQSGGTCRNVWGLWMSRWEKPRREEAEKGWGSV